MIVHIKDIISIQTLDEVIDAYNNLGDNSQIIIYLNSPGGAYNCMEAILNLINDNKEITTLIGYGCLFSSAFELFFNAKCNKKLIGGCNGMYHQSVMEVSMNETWKLPYSSDKSKKLYMTGYMHSKTLELCTNLKFSQEEIKDIKKDKDLYFDPIRMHNFLVVYK